MTLRQVMQQLRKQGTAQNRKVYARHGYSENMFGVSFANLRKLQKQIKQNHNLARELWETGNEDARMLACLIADPAAMSVADLDAWVAAAGHYALIDIFSGNVAAKPPHARKRLGPWTRSKRDFTAQAGWDIVANLAMSEPNIPDAEFEKLLATIEKKIHKTGNRARHAMNMALIAVGIRNPTLRKQALAAAARIGKVDVDHGETGCQTPDAAAYIKRAVARRTTSRRAGA